MESQKFTDQQFFFCCPSIIQEKSNETTDLVKFPYSPILHYACSSLLIQKKNGRTRPKRLDLQNALIRSSEKSSIDLAAFFKERSRMDLSCELKC